MSRPDKTQGSAQSGETTANPRPTGASKRLLSPYLEETVWARTTISLWRSVALGASLLAALFCLSSIFLLVRNMKAQDSIRYIIAPGPQTLQVVRPGELPESYIRSAMNHIAQLISSWNYDSIEDNYKELFRNFYTQDLMALT